MARREIYEFECRREHETDDAVLVTDSATGEQLWFPLSQVESMHFDAREQGTIVVTAWIAKQKGLI